MSDTATKALQIGDPAPNFTLPGGGSNTYSLSDYTGKSVVLFFYPKDSTPGCTTESKDFSALKDEFTAAGAVILGMSKDSVRRHDNFIAKQELTVDLVSDEDGKTIEDYGVWVEKKMYGKTYMGIERATFLIGPDGNIQHIWRKVKVKGHAQDVLDTVKSQ